MKKLVEIMFYSKDGKLDHAHILSTKMIKGLAGIKRIDELEDDCYAQAQLDASIVDAVKSNSMDVDHIVIFNDYAGTAEKYSIR